MLKKLTTLFLLLIIHNWGFTQNKKSYFIGRAQIGYNKTFPFKTNNIKLNAYSGTIIGLHAGYNRKKWSFRLEADYLFTQFNYVFSHAHNSQYTIHYNAPNRVFTYGTMISYII